jgi:tetratricopeptide (TPR) repeat protein
MPSMPVNPRAATRAACSRPGSSSSRPLPPNSANTVERIVDIRVDDHENPFKELRRLLYMTTGVPGRLTEAADKLVAEGKFSEAITELQKALEINPRSEQVHYALAQRYAQAGDTANALKWLGSAVSRQPAVWRPRAAEDALFAKLRSTPEFKKLIGS